MSVSAHWTALKQNKLCRKYLVKHFAACSVKQACGRNGCTYMHHELLHDDSRYQRLKNSQTSTPQATAVSHTEPCNTYVSKISKVLFRYVPVILHGRGKSVSTFAFLDDGSSATMIEHSLLKELNLEGESYPLCLGWIADHQRQETNSVMLALAISGVYEPNSHWIPKAHNVNSLSLSRQTLAMEELAQRYHHLKDLPADSYRNVRPRMLIGMDNIRLGHAPDSREGGINKPIATRTRLGWIVFGPCSTAAQSAADFTGHHSFHLCQCSERNDTELHNAEKAYFSLDSRGVMSPIKPLLSKDDERAERLLVSLSHLKEKRYETSLLWRYDDVRLPNSKSMAMRRLLCLERRMQREPQHTQRVHRDADGEPTFGAFSMRVVFLFPVVNPNKPGKLRILWDAAAKVAETTLNSFLLTGPDQLTSLPSVIRRFREFRIAVTGDIREMFHQVMVNRDDQQCQRFLWRDGEQDRSPDVCAMKMMTFGATCSPSCAQYVKNHNARRFQKQFPRAAEAIINEHYVDDMLLSEETDAANLAKDVRFVHAEAGFEIRNWLSNSKRVLQKLEAKPGEKSLNLCSEMGTEKVLGMWWCTATDTFTYKVSPQISADLLQGRIVPTKRQILSTLMMIYDPLGLLANFLVFLKMLLQEIRRSRVDWDEQIEDEQHKKWICVLKKMS